MSTVKRWNLQWHEKMTRTFKNAQNYNHLKLKLNSSHKIKTIVSFSFYCINNNHTKITLLKIYVQNYFSFYKFVNFLSYRRCVYIYDFKYWNRLKSRKLLLIISSVKYRLNVKTKLLTCYRSLWVELLFCAHILLGRRVLLRIGDVLFKIFVSRNLCFCCPIRIFCQSRHNIISLSRFGDTHTYATHNPFGIVNWARFTRRPLRRRWKSQQQQLARVYCHLIPKNGQRSPWRDRNPIELLRSYF